MTDSPSNCRTHTLMEVNWSLFKEEVEEACNSFNVEPNLTARVIRFNTTLKTSGINHVDKTKSGTKTKPFMTRTVRAALKKRNELRKTVKNNRRQWLDACKKAQEAVKTAKEES